MEATFTGVTSAECRVGWVFDVSFVHLDSMQFELRFRIDHQLISIILGFLLIKTNIYACRYDPSNCL